MNAEQIIESMPREIRNDKDHLTYFLTVQFDKNVVSASYEVRGDILPIGNNNHAYAAGKNMTEAVAELRSLCIKNKVF